MMARTERPNYFLAIRLTDPALLVKLREVQDQLLVAEPSLRWGLVPLAEAHITLNVFHVEAGLKFLQIRLQSFVTGGRTGQSEGTGARNLPGEQSPKSSRLY